VSAGPQQELDASTSGLGEMVRLARAALEHATAALMQRDPPLQESMAACGRALHTLDHALEDHAAAVLAARGRLGTGQLPMVLVAVHVNAEVEALGTLARQLGEIAVDRFSRPAFPTEVSVALRKMKGVCLDAVAQAAEVMAFPSSRAESDRQAKIAELRRELYRDLLSGGNAVDIASASEASLAARYYELGVAHAAAVIEHGALLTTQRPDESGSHDLPPGASGLLRHRASGQPTGHASLGGTPRQ
jgi:phosphate uptake regulator